MFSELDDLKQLTQSVALESLDFSKEKEEADEADHGAMIIDGEMDNRPFEKGDKIPVIRVQGDADKKPIWQICGYVTNALLPPYEKGFGDKWHWVEELVHNIMSKKIS